MQATSELVEIPKVDHITTDYVEYELTKRNITPLRWAIISVSDTIITISVAKLKQ